MQKLRQNTSYLQLSGMNNWLCASMTIFAQRFNILQSKTWGNDGTFRSHVAARLAMAVVLILLLYLPTSRQPKLAQKRQIWHG